MNKTIVSIIMLVSLSLILSNISASEAKNNISNAQNEWNLDINYSDVPSDQVSDNNDNNDDQVSDNKVSDNKVSDNHNSDKSDNNDDHKSSNHESKSNKAKVTIVLNDYGCYKGKVKATLKNVDLGITFFKNKVISLKHDHSETFKYDAKNSLYYDELSLKISQGYNSWTSVEHWKKNLRIDASVEEIDDCGYPD